MSITGALDRGGRDLVLTRTLAAPAERVWAHLCRSELLATWYGTVTGDPAAGSVEVTMTAEPGDAVTAEYVIHACEPPRLLSVSSAAGEETWRLTLELTAVGAGTRVRLRHHDVPRAMLRDVGPGWEWYLDRLTGAVTGGRIPGLDVWESEYQSLEEAFAALIG